MDQIKSNMANFSDYIVYVDESGDHGLKSINRDFPVFALSFCLVRKDEYLERIVPDVQELKFWGHDMVVLHENEIRKPPRDGSFTWLRTDRQKREEFRKDLNELISRIPFAIFAVIIRKRELENECKEMFHPYHLAMVRGMNLLSEFLLDKNQNNTVNHIVCESRGKTEDKILEVEFGHILQDSSFLGGSLKYELVIANKRVNSTGLQIADLTARPIAYKNLHPDRDNRPYEIIQDKIKKTDVPPP